MNLLISFRKDGGSAQPFDMDLYRLSACMHRHIVLCWTLVSGLIYNPSLHVTLEMVFLWL